MMKPPFASKLLEECAEVASAFWFRYLRLRQQNVGRPRRYRAYPSARDDVGSPSGADGWTGWRPRGIG
jgi:hypothetical protein